MADSRLQSTLHAESPAGLTSQAALSYLQDAFNKQHLVNRFKRILLPVIIALLLLAGGAAVILMRHRSTEDHQPNRPSAFDTTAITQPGGNPQLVQPPDTPEQHRTDSLRRIVDGGYRFQATPSGIRRKVAFLHAAYTLGDLHTKRYLDGLEPDMKLALSYFEKFMYLTEGADSDLGDDESLSVRARLCRKIASLYNRGILDVKALRSIYVGHYVAAAGIDFGHKLPAGGIASGTLDLAFVPGSHTLTKDTRSILDALVSAMKQDTALRIHILGGGQCDRAILQELSWEQVNAVQNFLAGPAAERRERCWMRYCDTGSFDHVYIRRVLDGEDGTFNVAPPHPFFLEGW